MTVVDYAGQSDTASLVVNISDDPVVLAVSWRFVGNIELPHETWIGNTTVVKAVAGQVPVPFDYVWDFGDGSPPETNTATTVDQAYALEAFHVYTASEGTPIIAEVRIIDAQGAVLASDTYRSSCGPRNSRWRSTWPLTTAYGFGVAGVRDSWPPGNG